MTEHRKMRVGMVGGGGPGNFFGAPHRTAILMDNAAELTAGALRTDPEAALESARELFFERGYPDYKTMAREEGKLPADRRIDYVTIVTPNDTHYPVAKAFLEEGIPVLCEKPLTMTLTESKHLVKESKARRLPFIVAYSYTALPMVMLAREMVHNGDIGTVRKVEAWYPQGWLATALEKTGQLQASWRTDPKQTGIGGCVGDIGTHAANLAEYISGLKITHICAELTTFVPGRPVDDDCNCLLKFDNGAKGVLHASQIAIGEENNLAIWVHGEKASLEWPQEHPNYLYTRGDNEPEKVWKRGNGYVAAYSAAAGRGSRIPSGHPEAFLEAFANNYMNFAETV